MFTGIIEATAPVLNRTDAQLIVERPRAFDDLAIGSSIAVSGACLSVVDFDERSMAFDVIAETWEKTKLGSLSKGNPVNLERAMQAGDRFHGHMVQGHVEGVGKVVSGEESKIHTLLTLSVPSDLLPLLIPKGSVTLDGVALTITRLQNDLCTVALIPHTLEHTTLGGLREGDPVNIETDVLGRYVYHLLRSKHED